MGRKRWIAAALAGATVSAVVLVTFTASSLGLVSFGFGEQTAEVIGQVKTEPVDGGAALAERFAPVLREDASELFVPVDRAGYVAATDLEWTSKGRSRAVLLSVFPRLADLPTREALCPAVGCRFFLDVQGARESGPASRYAAVQEHLLRTSTPTVYWHAVRYVESGEIAVQYWFLYVFNDFQNQHESDWEEITLRVDRDGNPLQAFFSSHEGGQVRPWDRVRKIGEHPVVYTGLGSHANYFEPGSQKVPLVECFDPKGLLAASDKALQLGGELSRSGGQLLGGRTCVRASEVAVDRAGGCGRVLAPSNLAETGTPLVEARCATRSSAEVMRYGLSELGPPAFVGSYGPRNLVAHGLIPVGELGPTDPQTRQAWSDPLALADAAQRS